MSAMLDDDFRPAPDTDRLIRNAQREAEIADTLPSHIPFITRLIMAGDIRQGEDAIANVREHRWTAQQALTLTGSYARVRVATTLWGEGLLDKDALLSQWPELWVGSDPDDTDPALWDIWHLARDRNGTLVTDEGHPLPGRGNRVRVYRGQRAGDPVGCSWSTDPKVAERFARTGGGRALIADGHVLRVVVPKAMVIAYLTGRGEAECIIDPREMGWVR